MGGVDLGSSLITRARAHRIIIIITIIQNYFKHESSRSILDGDLQLFASEQCLTVFSLSLSLSSYISPSRSNPRQNRLSHYNNI